MTIQGPEVVLPSVRANVILELINSERDFVKHLKDVVEGYLHPARRHPEIFTSDRINTIFANIEPLYEFQKKFLESLEKCINLEEPEKSQVGQCFLDYEAGFSVYYYYCNNHPNAISELQDLYTKPRFVKFFEACRLLQNMIDISLDGFLLTPIQRICKYPLQLNELLKNTDENHPDYKPVADALESMRNCANLANERKRRIEALADVLSFQEKIDNWYGEKITDTSSILIHSGEVSKMNAHSWTQGAQLYLFDHLLLYCKKDLLKRNSLILKEKIWMDKVTEISDADEYKPRKSFKLLCGEQRRWFVFTTRTEAEKEEWIRAFEKERNLVETDENEGFRITDKELGVAKRTLHNRKLSRSARYRHKRPDTAIVDTLDIDDAQTIINRTLSLPSCIHPSHVLNFCEDSRVVTLPSASAARYKKGAHSPRNLSPMGGSQSLTDEESNQNSSNQSRESSVSWFKKMGSKKLSKSQMYDVNGISNGGKPATNSPIEVSMFDGPTIEYDELEKRHRDHMISEEQARLFRLNNDPQARLFGKPQVRPDPATRQKTTPSQDRRNSAAAAATAVIGEGHEDHETLERAREKPIREQETDEMKRIETSSPVMGLNFQALNLSQSPDSNYNAPVDDGRSYMSVDPAMIVPYMSHRSHQIASSTETTVMLSSGRIVRVREDEV